MVQQEAIKSGEPEPAAAGSARFQNASPTELLRGYELVTSPSGTPMLRSARFARRALGVLLVFLAAAYVAAAIMVAQGEHAQLVGAAVRAAGALIVAGAAAVLFFTEDEMEPGPGFVERRRTAFGRVTTTRIEPVEFLLEHHVDPLGSNIFSLVARGPQGRCVLYRVHMRLAPARTLGEWFAAQTGAPLRDETGKGAAAASSGSATR
jgi:hypothetical protein